MKVQESTGQKISVCTYSQMQCRTGFAPRWNLCDRLPTCFLVSAGDREGETGWTILRGFRDRGYILKQSVRKIFNR